jgi:Calcineurin-like phosphoesterase
MISRNLPAVCSLLLITCFCGMTAYGQMPELAPLPGTGHLSSPSNPEQFSFVVAGDNRPAHAKCPQPAIPRQIFSAVPKMDPAPALLLWTGDTISGKRPDKPKRIQQEYDEFLAIAKTANTPVFNAPGNHEMDDGNDVPSKVMKVLYRKYMGATYGAFTYGNSRFIALDSENELPSDSASTAPETAGKKGKSGAPGYITGKQLTLLQLDLEASKDKAHVFLFLHHPVKPAKPADGLAPESVKALENLFKNYRNISYVISGHEHMYYNAQGNADQVIPPPSRSDPSQPPYYLVSGGAGAPLKNLPGGFYHYLVFKVDGNSVSPSLVKVEPNLADEDCQKQ